MTETLYAACIVPAAPVRKKASHKVEMVNQLLFGEMVRVIRAKKSWYKVQGLHDNYEGWIRNNQLIDINTVTPNDSLFVAGDLMNTIIKNGVKMNVPVGSSLPWFHNGAGSGEVKYEFKGYSFNRTETKPTETTIWALTDPWLNAPYLWGGRTPLGVDCSGFSQVIFKMMGIDLLRDAWQQADQGMKIKTLADARCGDLAFFNKGKKIIHVGILLSSSQIIHASGNVRIDGIDEKGITNADTGKRTHKLVAIRRYW